MSSGGGGSGGVGGGGGAGGDPSWAWLGLLKWSIAHTDGTKPSSESMKPMSDEDRAFLEAAMESVGNPADRMQELLSQLTVSLNAIGSPPDDGATSPETKKDTKSILDEDGMVDALDELRDLVEQIDYARDFVKMNGLPFLLGCAQEEAVPRRVRVACLGVLSTLCQNNPPVQKAMLEMDCLSLLSGLYAREMDRDPDGSMRTMIVQVLSCMVRGSQVGEDSFCQSAHCRAIVENGLGVGGVLETPIKLRKKCVFLLRALVCSDFSSRKRVRDFSASIQRVVDFIDPSGDDDLDLRELSLTLLLKILEQKLSVNAIMDEKDRIAAIGVQRVAYLRALPEGEEKETAYTELELWEGLITELAKGSRDAEDEDEGSKDAAPLMIKE